MSHKKTDTVTACPLFCCIKNNILKDFFVCFIFPYFNFSTVLMLFTEMSSPLSIPIQLVCVQCYPHTLYIWNQALWILTEQRTCNDFVCHSSCETFLELLGSVALRNPQSSRKHMAVNPTVRWLQPAIADGPSLGSWLGSVLSDSHLSVPLAGQQQHLLCTLVVRAPLPQSVWDPE